MGVKKVTLFIGIINCFSIKDKWEVAGFVRIPVAVDKFPTADGELSRSAVYFLFSCVNVALERSKHRLPGI